MTHPITIEIMVECFATTAEMREERLNAARDAVVEVLERHGYNLPGIADLAAGGALKAAGLSL